MPAWAMASLLEIFPLWRLDCLLFLVATVSVLYAYMMWKYRHWQLQDVPFVKPVLFFGNIGDYITRKKALSSVYQDLYMKLEDHPYGGFYKCHQPAILLRDLELIKTVLVKEFHNFSDNEFQVSEEVDPVVGKSPSAQHEERWKDTRNLLTPAMTVAKIRPIFPLMMEVTKEALVYLEKLPEARSQDGVDIKQFSLQFATDIIASSVFGLKGNAFRDPEADFWNMAQNIVVPNLWKDLKHFVVVKAPKLAEILGFRIVDAEVSDFFYRAVKHVVSYRDENNFKRMDFMQTMMQIHKTDSDENTGYSLEDIAAHGTMFFTEGCDPCATALAFTLFELAHNADVQEQLREEVVAATGAELTYEKLQEMELLDRVVSESLRKHPPVPALTRLSAAGATLGGRPLEANTPVVVPILALHRDPALYPDPELFDPRRFAEPAVAARHRFAYLPFGEGPRVCLGMRFALSLVKVAVAGVVRRFELRPCPHSVLPVALSPHHHTLTAAHGLRVTILPRHDT
ncbi:probable cytochrome P450 6a13 [Schistocerca piceifrons]|uniref:probable cytochrome P450 6a13 n=1 Tax=Schistocerca piceifrons TaxID=274613 RepID=UPI001F5EB7FA|nr:probable cytochrome P450 6a13 [Schistocerca piceifrons]